MLAVAGWGGGAQAASLYEALATAYATNPTLEAARAQLRATDEGVPQVLSEWRPTVLGTAQGGHEWDQQNKPLELDTETNPRSYGVTVRQPIFDGFGTVAGTSLAENLVLSGRAQLTDTEQNVLLNAVTAYMNVVRDASVLDLNRNNEKVLQRQLEATQARFDVGELTRTDVAQAEASLQGAIAARIQAEGQLTASQAIYRQIIGDDPVDVKMPDRDAGAACEPRGIGGAVAGRAGRAVGRIPGTRRQGRYRRAVQRPAADRLDRRQLAAPAGCRPARQRNRRRLGDRAGDDPALSGGRAGFARAAVQAALHAIKRLTDEALRAAEREAVNSWTALQTATAQSRSFEEQVRANEFALDGVRQEQEVGARTILDVLDAQQALLNSQVSLVSSQTDRVVAEYRLLAAGGALTAQHLALNVEYYDPTRITTRCGTNSSGPVPASNKALNRQDGLQPSDD